MNKEAKYWKKQFIILTFGFLAILIILGTALVIKDMRQDKEIEECKFATVEIVKILTTAQQACIDYANLTLEEFNNVYLDWGIEKIKNGEDPFH